MKVMKWIEVIFGAIREYLKRVNKVPQSEIDAREREKTETKNIIAEIRQIRLTKRKARALNRWFRWAVRNGHAQRGEDKVKAYLRFKETNKNF